MDHRQGKGKSLECKSRSSGVEFLPFKALSPLAASSEEEEEKPASALPELSLQSPAINRTLDLVTPVALGDHRGFGGFRKATEWVPATLGLQSQLQPPRKARRCWSQELHRRFVLAIQQLGGAQGKSQGSIFPQLSL